MFLKKRNKILLTFSLLISSLSLASCSAFFGGDEGYLISDLSTTTDSEGNTIVTITFDNEDIAPVVFTIPKGISGDPGVGIESITPSLNSEGNEVTLTITYTDSSLEPTVLTIPVISGENGVGISNVIVGKDEIGNTTIQFEYSDGSTSDIITINKGEDGVDGNGIENFEVSYDPISNSYRIVVSFTDEAMEDQVFTITNGRDGNGIVNITTKEDSESYTLIIEYSDGSSQEISFSKPSINRWLNGNGTPSNNIGNSGDFYFDSNSGTIYRKEGDNWLMLFSLNQEQTTTNYQVTFHTNGGNWRFIDSQDPSSINRNKTLVVNKGDYINLNDDTFEIYREGYSFNGWWTDMELTPNSGHFTNLTAVNSNLDLYASWISE